MDVLFFVHVNNGKLAPKARKCVLLGYASKTKGYQLWYPNFKKVIQSQDVTFNETLMFFPKQKYAIRTGNIQDDSEKVEL